MKTALILFASSLILFAASSCSQCNTCRHYPATDVKLCKKDYTEQSYTEAIHYYEGQGYDCE